MLVCMCIYLCVCACTNKNLLYECERKCQCLAVSINRKFLTNFCRIYSSKNFPLLRQKYQFFRIAYITIKPHLYQGKTSCTRLSCTGLNAFICYTAQKSIVPSFSIFLCGFLETDHRCNRLHIFLINGKGLFRV